MTRRVFHYTDTNGYGGAEQALLHVLAGLDRDRWTSVLLYHPSPGVAPLVDAARQLDVRLIPLPSMPEGISGASHVPEYSRILRANCPDVFHAHLTRPLACKWGLAGAIAAGVPAIMATVQLFVEVHASLSSYLQQRLLCLGVDRYIAVSRDVAQHMQRRFCIPSHKLTVIHNGIALDRFDGTSLQPALRATTTAQNFPIVLTSARLDAQKGHEFLLRAAALVPEAHFMLAGDGPLREVLESQSRTLGIEERVTFLGYRDDIPELLSMCDVFVLPSLFEGLPLSVLEAMAAGKPVISSAIGGTDEVIKDGKTGLLVPPADPVALARAIRLLLTQPELSHRIASAGKALVHDQFSSEAMIRQIAVVYDELLGA